MLGSSALLISLLLKMTPKHWVEKLPVDRFGIDEDQKIRSGTLQATALGAYSGAMGQKIDVDETEMADIVPPEEEGEPVEADEENGNQDGYARG